MRISKVPIDMSSEQKNIEGMLSTRQAIYLGVGGVILYAYIPIIFKLFSIGGSILAFTASLIAALPVAAPCAALAFIKLPKYNMFLDSYLLIILGKKRQRGSWRKGA